ncbi:hypothetical protein ACHHYP_15856 [Achlya hypogyna]|uniref:Pentacotripeptide-repeat region of PRORP domain-containing protein n=1 Tax=Achlya hypogyna TaxID=1202772 RepID=A0A1V9YA54_ACHHY|nr:hypothetical protein ACHHYP_15856 [Achlya hypogyna]
MLARQSAASTWRRVLVAPLSAARVHTNSHASDEVEKAVAQATASLLARIATMEEENRALKQQLQDAIKASKLAAPPEEKRIGQKERTTKPDTTTKGPAKPVQTRMPREQASMEPSASSSPNVEVVAVPTSTVGDSNAMPSENASIEKVPPRNKPPNNKLFYRLMWGSKTLCPSPTLRETLNEVDVFSRQWEIHEIPAVMNCLVLVDRVPDALAFAKKWTNSITMLNHLLREAARVKCPKLALGLLQLGVERNYDICTTSYNMVIIACARGPASYLSTVEHLLSDMQERGHRPNAATFGGLLVTTARLNHWITSQSALDMMDTLPTDERVAAYASVLVRLSRFDHHEFCYRVFKHTVETGLPLGEEAIRSVISSCGKISRRDDALEMLNVISVDSIQSLRTFNALIAAYANLDPAKAFDVFRALQQRELNIDIFTVNSVLLACVRQRLFADGVELFESRPVPFDVVTICTMLQLCGQAKDAAKALDIFKQARETLPLSRPLLEELVEALVEADAGDKALNEFEELKPKIEFVPTLKLLNGLLRAARLVPDCDAAGRQVLDWFEGAGVSMSSVSANHMLLLLLQAKKLDEAAAWLDEIRRRGLVTYFSYQQLMVAYFDAGDYAKCLEVYNQCTGQRLEMLQQVKWKPYAFPRTGIVVLAQRAHFALGNWDKVIAMAPLVKGRQGTLHSWLSDRGCQELLQKAILAHEQRGDWEGCVSTYSMMVAVGMNDTEAYQATVRAVAKAGEFEAALDVNGGEWYRNERSSKGWFSGDSS